MRRSDRGVVVLAWDGPLEVSLLKLKQQLLRAGLFRELRRREAYVRPGQAKRRKRALAAKRRRLAAARLLVAQPWSH